MNRVAVIDIGTNSTRLLVADKAGTGLKVVETGLIITRLGEGIDSGMLLPQAMERTAGAVEMFREKAAGLGARRVAATATSAARDAINRNEFLNLIRLRAGLQVRVLSGEEEACLSYLGVTAGLDIEPDTTMVIDIGGGSTELIWKSENLRLSSVNVGAVRLTESGYTESQVFHKLQPLLDAARVSGVRFLVGVGGTITTLAAIDLKLATYDRERVHGYSMPAFRIKQILSELQAMSLEERKKLQGLPPGRADIIVAGAAIVKVIMDGTGIDKLVVSEYDILYGLALKEVEIN